MQIRLMTIDDYDKVYALWKAAGMGLNNLDDSREGIEKYLLRNPNTSFIAEDGGEIIGNILSGHDGRRGFIQHALVSENRRREGIGAALVDAALTALKAEGINKVALLAFVNNEPGNEFWESQGFTLRTDVNYRNRQINDSMRYDI